MNAYRFLWLPEFIQRILLALVRRKNKLLVNLHKPNYSDSIKKYQLCRPLGPKPVICYAPFKSMYFGMNGKVVACCLNRSHVFGRYPEQNISEIWNGQKIKELRDVLKHADLSKGCFHCKNRIDDGNFDAVEAALFDVIPLKNHYPAMMEFELSNECNLQ
ncbi:MAG: SPASM domain-containing protein, partial [Bacteroidales bacterium]|nr:SPASM domain-containing protein [Bacteroidales bacterium]